jgi:glutaminyl-tRNA synthetase
MEILPVCYVEPALSGTTPGTAFQFERLGYFCQDPLLSSKDRMVFNRSVTLKDSWANIQKSSA